MYLRIREAFCVGASTYTDALGDSSLIQINTGGRTEDILKQEKVVPYNELLHNLLSCVHKYSMRDERMTCANQMLVHHKNRGVLMLRVQILHANAAIIRKVGADKNQLCNAVRIEMAEEGGNMDINIKKQRTCCQD